MSTKTQFVESFSSRKRNANERWESSQKKKNKNGFSFSASTDFKPFGKPSSVSDSRRNAKETENSFLMIKAKIHRERSESMELIPACVPESVGLEIENILHSSFGHNKSYHSHDSNGTSDDGTKEKKSPGKRSSPKKKSPRTMSTEDLPPNMLPEDYLDEVISQYFNNDSSSDDQNNTKKFSSDRRESLNKYLSDDNSSNEEDEEGDKEEVTEEEEDEPVKPSKSKIKTDEEIESEYKHIIFGAKKRKGPRLGFGSPKKKKKSKERSETKRKPTDSFVKPLKVDKLILKKERNFEENLNTETEIDKRKKLKMNNVDETISTNSNTSDNKKTNEINSIKLEIQPVQKWTGKRASKKAFDRSKMIQTGKKLFTSSKIEDVTGKYSKEEELVTCGICELLDPPVDPDNPQTTAETTEWVGCDCYRWFHKSCTKLTKFTEKFSCKSVRMKCQEAPGQEEPIPAVLQVAILRFIRDRDVSFIEDLLW